MPLPIARKHFYERYRKQFTNKLSQTQVDGFEAMFDYWEGSSLSDLRWLAYCLATAYHETGKTMAPVREGFAKSDAESIRVVTQLFEQGRIKRNYALPHANGQSYFGRGLVQITHGYNYERVGKAIGLERQLYDNPSLALDLKIAVRILFVGMVEGLFTRKRLEDYLNNSKTDYKNARRIVNALDRADLIAGYARKFYLCLTGKPA